MVTLYDAAWAPSPRRVRLFLAEKRITVARETLDLRKGQHLGEPYLNLNPRGLVPALMFDDGEILTESAAICRYFEAIHPEPSLFGNHPLAIGRIESWTRRIEGDGYAAAVLALREADPRFRDRPLAGRWPPMPQLPELTVRAQALWQAFIRSLDERLADHEWIADEAYSFADITALVTIDFARAGKLVPPEEATHLARWYAAASQRPSAVA